MASNTTQGKICVDAAADIISSTADSLSFSGFICIQDQLSSSPKPPPIGHVLPPPPPKHNPEFEFDRSRTGSLKKVPFSNGQADGQNGISSARKGNGYSKRKPTSNEVGYKVAEQPRKGTREPGNIITGDGKENFGQKLMKSFASPCRGCRATETTKSIKVQRAQQVHDKFK